MKEDIERTVTALREAYAQMRTFYSRRGTYHSVREHDNQWAKIAPALLQHGINPQHFVKTTFEYYLYELRKPVAWVNQVANQKAIARYLERQRVRHDELKLLLDLQMDTVDVQQRRRGRTVEDIIKDPTLELSVVVRYALALKAGLAELAAEMRPDAELDLKYEPLYQQFVERLLSGAEQ